jgi:CRISPR/Cas system CSM-associated protein Csm4 (group 5 of RAMP superfamily)
MKIHWIEAKDQLPKNKERVLLLVKRKDKTYITEGYIEDVAERLAKAGHLTKEQWEKHGKGLTWFDYAGRQIQSYKSKNSSSSVLKWAVIDESDWQRRVTG